VAVVSPSAIKGASPSDKEIETLYQDMAKLIQLLLFVICQAGYDPGNTAEIVAKNAAYFWASVRGERTEGHPNYHAPPTRSRHSPDDRKTP
jgi:hypothetical protein